MVTPVLEWNKIKAELYISLKVEKLNLKTACAVKNFILVNLKSHLHQNLEDSFLRLFRRNWFANKALTKIDLTLF